MIEAINNLDFDNMSSSDFFSLNVGLMIAFADVSDFEDNEIRTLRS